MKTAEFNLLQEPWLLALDVNGRPMQLSLLDCLAKAHLLKELAGELPTQDFAILRLLLSMLHAAFGRQVDGTHLPIPGQAQVRYPEDLLDRWQLLYQAGQLPMQVLEPFLQTYQDHFFLFHPTRPFYQIPRPDRATEYGAAKLNGALSESSNKARLFPDRTGQAKAGLSFAEAARWLVHLNGYDDTSAKASERGGKFPSVGAGWLGKLGAVYARGETLFETLLLNLVLQTGEGGFWSSEQPAWALQKPRVAERSQIPVPDNPSQLLTLQSRRLSLHREGDQVVGFSLLGGDFYGEADEVFIEQLTLWNRRAKPEEGKRDYDPRRHDSARQLWRDLPALLADRQGHRPGVVSWLATLRQEGLLNRDFLQFQTTGISYADKDFFANDVLQDSLSFSTDILQQGGEQAVYAALAQLKSAEAMVGELGNLARNLAQAAGEREGKGAREAAMEQGYHALDLPYRRFLAGLMPLAGDAVLAAELAWQQQAKAIIRDLGQGLISQAGPAAFVGKVVKVGGKERLVTAAKAYSWFLHQINAV